MTNVHTKVEKNERLHNQATALSWGLLYANNHLCFILQVIESHGKVKQGNDIVIFAFREESFWSDGTVLSWLGVVKLIYVCQSLSRVRLFATPWTVACQAPLSMEFSKQEYWSGLPFPSPGYLPNPGIKPASLVSPALQADSLPLWYGDISQKHFVFSFLGVLGPRQQYEHEPQICVR